MTTFNPCPQCGNDRVRGHRCPAGSAPVAQPSTLVFLESQEDDERCDDLALHATFLSPSKWNGFPVPLVTATEFRRFVTAWAHNDPNGLWEPAGVRVGAGVLLYDDGESDEPEVWRLAGRDANGTALYAIDGWTWQL